MKCLCDKTREIIEEWSNKQGHDRCWYYPDLFKKLIDLYDIKVNQPILPSLEEFKEGCKKFQEEEYGLR